MGAKKKKINSQCFSDISGATENIQDFFSEKLCNTGRRKSDHLVY